MVSIEEITHRYPGFERGYRRGREEAALIHDSEQDIRQILTTLKEVDDREKYVPPAVADYLKQLEGVPLSEEAMREYRTSNAGEALGYIVGHAVGLLGKNGLKHAKNILTSITALPPEAAARILEEHILPLVKTPRYLLGETRREYRDPRIDRALRAITRIRKKAAIRTTARHLQEVYAATGGKLHQLERAKKDISAARVAIEQGSTAAAKKAIQSRIEAIRSREDLREHQKSRAIERYQRIMEAIDRGSHQAAVAELKRIEKAIDHDISILSKNGDRYSRSSMQHMGKTSALSIGRSEFDVENFSSIAHLAKAGPEFLKFLEKTLDEMDAEIGHANRLSHYLRDDRITKNLVRLYGIYTIMKDSEGLQQLKKVVKTLAETSAKGQSDSRKLVEKIVDTLRKEYVSSSDIERILKETLTKIELPSARK